MTAILFSSYNLHPFTSLTREWPKLVVIGSFFLRSIFWFGLCPLFFLVTFFFLSLLWLSLVCGIFGDTFGTSSSTYHFDCPHWQKEHGICYCYFCWSQFFFFPVFVTKKINPGRLKASFMQRELAEAYTCCWIKPNKDKKCLVKHFIVFYQIFVMFICFCFSNNLHKLLVILFAIKWYSRDSIKASYIEIFVSRNF